PLGPSPADDRVTTYQYDASGEHLARVTAPGNRVTSYSYETAGTLQQRHALTGIVHPDQTENSFAYDTQGRLTNTDGTCCGGAQKVTYAYDSAGTVTVTDAGPKHSTPLRPQWPVGTGARRRGTHREFWLR